MTERITPREALDRCLKHEEEVGFGDRQAGQFTVRYRHSKTGTIYHLLFVALNRNTLEPAFFYQGTMGEFWYGPLHELTEEVEVDGQMVPRFVKCPDLKVVQQEGE